MNIFEFMSSSPILTVIIIYILVTAIAAIINRFFRMINIWKNGYPPPHCDADGDFPKQEEKAWEE